MTDRVKYRPFTGDSDISVRLVDAPLELVLCQVRWPQFTGLQTEEQLRAITPEFGQAMPEYPLVAETKNVNYVITPDGIASTDAGTVYQWTSVDDVWHVSLSRQFLSLYTTTYGTYDEMDSRLRPILNTLREIVGVRVIDRVGVRYVNRLSDPSDMANLDSIVRPEILGYKALHLQHMQASTNQATYSLDGAILQVRSGILPPNQTVDPAIALTPSDSWVLDLDASQEVRQILDTDAVAAIASRMSDVAYDYFKAVIAEGFLNRHSERDTES